MKKSDFRFIIPVFIFYFVIESLGVSCPIKFLTGISCAGCGMSRAWLSLLKMDFVSAFHYHPLFFLPAVALIVYLLREKMPVKVYKMSFILMAVAMMVVYVIRLFDVNDSIVVFEPMNNIISRMLKYISKKG